ncbi:hypothetical protein MOQ72_37610 [Saccharopolyspora sp. K220]|uniref:hypothetical protein n=1 Tax=Saccharopolyspora soli TaxID=2926618 RepID=UPI001F5939AB|nr:hypothetical protein [Saccharopolyspora soli]MCI2423152.1 hypothetical protein [Saccharopolyspora soli]
MPPQRHRLIEAARLAASFVVSLNASATYLAVSRAGVIGAAPLQFSPTALSFVAAAFIVVGLVVSEFRHRVGAEH